MLFLFCSAATPLYRKDAIASIAYPAGHIFRFRYANRYVDQNVLKYLRRFENKEGVLVFADIVAGLGAVDFAFYPMRMIKTIRLSPVAGAIYVDFRFGDFVNFGSDTQRQTAWHEFLKGLAGRPWPPSAKSGRPPNQEGYFLLSADDKSLGLTTRCEVPYENWNNLVNRLDHSNDLAKSTFCLFLGFFHVKRNWRLKLSEIKLKSTDNQFDTTYPIPMGRSVVLKLLLSRPSFDYDDPASARVLNITSAGDTFSGMSKSIVHSESRYNEERIVLVCRRVFDVALSVVSIEELNETTARSPSLALLTKVNVPTWVMLMIVSGVALSTLLLAMDAEVLKFMATFLDDPWKLKVDSNAKTIAAILKVFAPVPVAISAFLAFKRLPIK